jgi:hypothetical protein
MSVAGYQRKIIGNDNGCDFQICEIKHYSLFLKSCSGSAANIGGFAINPIVSSAGSNIFLRIYRNYCRCDLSLKVNTRTLKILIDTTDFQ